MRGLVPAGVMVAAVLLAAEAVRPGQANEDEAVRLQAENKILRSELDRRNKEIDALKAEAAKLADQVKQLRELCEKAGIAPPAEVTEVGTAVEEPKTQAPEQAKKDGAPLSLADIEKLIRQTYTLEPGETALRTAQRRKELDDAVIRKRVVLSAVVTQVTKPPGLFKNETVAQVELQHKSRETVKDTDIDLEIPEIKDEEGKIIQEGKTFISTGQFPKLNVTITIGMDVDEAVKLRTGQTMKLDGRVESLAVKKASAKGTVRIEMGVGIENKPTE